LVIFDESMNDIFTQMDAFDTLSIYRGLILVLRQWTHVISSGRQFKGHVCGQENGVGDSLGMRLLHVYGIFKLNLSSVFQ